MSPVGDSATGGERRPDAALSTLAAMTALGAVWTLRGGETLFWPHATSTALELAMPGLPRSMTGPLTLLAGCLQLFAGAGLSAKRVRSVAALAGTAITGAMLLIVAVGFPRLQGMDCGCLRLFSPSTFGWGNVAFLAGSLLLFAFVAGTPGPRQAPRPA